MTMPGDADTLARIKVVARSFFDLLNERRVDDAMALLDDAGTWWNVARGRPCP